MMASFGPAVGMRFSAKPVFSIPCMTKAFIVFSSAPFFGVFLQAC